MLIDNYQKLVPSYNRSKTKFMTLFDAVIGQVCDVGTLHESIPSAFNPNTAVGDQLDVVGSVLGVNRDLPFAPLHANRRLDDDTYRMVILGKIAKNHWDGTMATLPDLLSSVFQDYRFDVVDNQDMSLSVTVLLNPEADREFCLELLNAGLIFPIPSGISVNFTISVPISVGAVKVKTGAHESGNIIIKE